MLQISPPISEDLKRLVRQKCKFGCVICGCPIYDYDHIDDRSVNELDNLTLLCTFHHRQKANGILSRDIVKNRTENTRDKPGQPEIKFSDCSFMLGNNEISTVPMLCFGIYGQDYIRLAYDKEIEQIVVNARFYDVSGKISFQIKDNIYSSVTDAWDVEMRGNELIIREENGKVQLQIIIDGNKNVISLQGKFYFEQHKFLEFSHRGIRCNGYTLMSDCTVQNCKIGFLIAPLEISQSAAFFGGGFKNCKARNSETGFATNMEYLNYLYSKPPGNDDVS